MTEGWSELTAGGKENTRERERRRKGERQRLCEIIICAPFTSGYDIMYKNILLSVNMQNGPD